MEYFSTAIKLVITFAPPISILGSMMAWGSSPAPFIIVSFIMMLWVTIWYVLFLGIRVE
mgnify:CR=1 FL=1